jgi:putative DNA primase/helicase
MDLIAESPRQPDSFAARGSSDPSPDTIEGGRSAPSAFDLQSFLGLRLSPPELLLAPWLPRQGAAMIYGPRGLGKTQVGLNVAYAVASGGRYLGWTARAPRRVTYLDGEMPAIELQRRLREIEAAADDRPPHPSFLRIVSDSLSPLGLPDLSDSAGQQLYDASIDGSDLIIVDNISTLCRGYKENDADTWTPIQHWVLAQRRAGRTVLFIHHAGKSGNQRGTSRKEDILDTVVALRRPPDWSATRGAYFEVHFEKSRGFFGADAEPIMAELTGSTWKVSEIEPLVDQETLMALESQGLSLREIAMRTGLSKSTLQRRLKQLPKKGQTAGDDP